MKRATRPKSKSGAARDLFSELSEGMEALTDARQGKRTLLTYAVEFRPAPNITRRNLVVCEKLEAFVRPLRGLSTE